MAVITVSRQIGAGGWALAKRVSEKLGYRYVDEMMIKEVADKVGVTAEDVRALEKDGATKLMKFLDRVVSRDFIDRLLSDKYGYVDEGRYVDVVTAIIKELHGQGNVVIVGRGGQFILNGYNNVWRILLVDDLKNRVRNVMETYRLKEKDAEKFIRVRDRIRTNFLSFFADKESHDDPLSYDLVLNMKKIGMEKAEQFILALVG